MLFLSCFVSCAGSTGGGIKMIRAIVLYKLVYRELIRAMHPNAVHPVKVAGEVIPANILFAVLAFAYIYMLCIVSMTLALSFSGVDTITAFSAALTSYMVNEVKNPRLSRGYCSDVGVSVSRTANIRETGQIPVRLRISPLAYSTQITIEAAFAASVRS
jgi:hypothetical protein